MIEGKWEQLKGTVRKQWGKLTDNDLETLKGSVDEFIGKLQGYYGYTKEKAKEEFEEFKKKNPSYFGEKSEDEKISKPNPLH